MPYEARSAVSSGDRRPLVLPFVCHELRPPLELDPGVGVLIKGGGPAHSPIVPPCFVPSPKVTAGEPLGWLLGWQWGPHCGSPAGWHRRAGNSLWGGRNLIREAGSSVPKGDWCPGGVSARSRGCGALRGADIFP